MINNRVPTFTGEGPDSGVAVLISTATRPHRGSGRGAPPERVPETRGPAVLFGWAPYNEWDSTRPLTDVERAVITEELTAVGLRSQLLPRAPASPALLQSSHKGNDGFAMSSLSGSNPDKALIGPDSPGLSGTACCHGVSVPDHAWSFHSVRLPFSRDDEEKSHAQNDHSFGHEKEP